MQKGAEKVVWSSGGASELFDVVRDAAEEHDLSDARVEQARTMQKALFEWFAGVRSKQGKGQRAVLDERTKRQLESLGYVQ
jgi:hypothetical protein